MVSSDPAAIKASINDLAFYYGIEVVGFLRIDPARIIPADELDLLKGVRWCDGEVCLANVQNPLEIMPSAKAMVILGKRLMDDKKDVYYQVSDRYSASAETMLLDLALPRILRDLGESGFSAEEYTSYYLKVWAVLAGLGWIGKSRMFVSKDHGPRLRLKAILTDADIGETAEVIPDERCGTCRDCIDACPAGAIEETQVDRKKCGSCQLNHRRISENATSYCTMCTAACPVGKK